MANRTISKTSKFETVTTTDGSTVLFKTFDIADRFVDFEVTIMADEIDDEPTSGKVQKKYVTFRNGAIFDDGVLRTNPLHLPGGITFDANAGIGRFYITGPGAGVTVEWDVIFDITERFR